MILRRSTNAQAGFTIIELLIATMVFSVILLGATTALFRLERMYYRGIVTNQTQTTSRQIMANISQQLQLNQNRVTITPPNNYYTGVAADFQAICIGTTRYSYILNGQVNDDTPSGQYVTSNHHIQHGLWRDTIQSSQVEDCKPLNLSLPNPEDSDPSVAGPQGTAGSELLAQNMRLVGGPILNDGCASQSLCTITIKIVYGDDDLLAPDANNPIGCKTTFGDQWCAASGLQTQVFKRLQQNEGP